MGALGWGMTGVFKGTSLQAEPQVQTVGSNGGWNASDNLARSMQPFVIDWRQNAAALSDVSFMLDSPAGKDGFVTIRGGHLARPDGSRFRLWGINMTGASNLASHSDAPDVAAHLARFGINCVRMTFLDRVAPMGILEASRSDTRALDLAQVDRLDFFIAQLKKRGIYVYLNLNSGRTYKPGDGVRDAELIGFAKALTYFDSCLLFLQREYAKQLLTHFNPYTNTEYRNEPALALVKLLNENSLVESWVSNRLQGKNTHKNPGTWTDIPASYEEELTALYEAWLARRGLPPQPRLLTREEIDSAPSERFRRELSFYIEIESHHFESMRSYLKNELGVRSLLLATSDHNHSISGYPLLYSSSRLDVVDGHDYWQHPRYFYDPATGRQIGFSIPNTAMVNDPLHSTVVELSRSAIAGKPYTVSEVNHPFPAEHAAEGIPILTAYAAFQDWDGLFWYTFEESVDPSEWAERPLGFFNLRPDPVKMAEIGACALMFLRGDILPARETGARSYSLDQTMDSLRLPPTQCPYFTAGFPLALPLQYGSRIATLDSTPTSSPSASASEPIGSDTGELSWLKGLVLIDTPRTQAVVGRVTRCALHNFSTDIRNPFSAIILTSLDGAPIAQAKKMLLVTGSVVANTGMEWNQDRTTLVKWGRLPVVIEPVIGSIGLCGLPPSTTVDCTPLDGSGHPLSSPCLAQRTTDGWRIRIGEPATVWYLIEAR
jgi:hypothetical protein